jgi:hypothetical protein
LNKFKNRTVAKNARMRHPKFKIIRKLIHVSEFDELRITELRGNLVDVTGVEPATFPISSGRFPYFYADFVGWKSGGRDRDRTCDLIHAMDALSQLSYTPETEV